MQKKIVMLLLVAMLCVLFVLPALAASETASGGGNFGSNLAVTILVPLVISGIYCSAKKSAMKTARKQRAANAYIPADGFKLTSKKDAFLYRTETRRTIQTSSNK